VTELCDVCVRATRVTPWSRSRRKTISAAGLTAEGSVHAAGGGVYTILLSDGRTIDASLRGRLKQGSGRVVIGDRVTVAEAPDAWTVESVAKRTTELVRRGRGGRVPKVLAANLDRVFVVVAVRDPPANTDLIDRLLVLVESGGMRPTLVLNKVDLEGALEASRNIASQYEAIGYAVLGASAVSGAGLDVLSEELCRGTSALIGPSGVGKSTLLNALDPDLGLRTGELSRKGGTGRHTTVSSRLIGLSCGGFVADTPGFSDVALWGVEPEEVGRCFPEFTEYTPTCRFRTCTHVHEPDCGVRTALDEGRIQASRYDSYLKLRSEAVEAGER
jgi:ribosome biogenesis GTPase